VATADRLFTCKSNSVSRTLLDISGSTRANFLNPIISCKGTHVKNIFLSKKLYLPLFIVDSSFLEIVFVSSEELKLEFLNERVVESFYFWG